MRLKEIIVGRWKFYLPIYVLGYIISLIASGIPSIAYLIPINLSAFVFAFVIGNGFYHASKKLPVYYQPIKAFKYLLIMIALMFFFNWIKVGLLKVGFDITPVMGFWFD